MLTCRLYTCTTLVTIKACLIQSIESPSRFFLLSFPPLLYLCLWCWIVPTAMPRANSRGNGNEMLIGAVSFHHTPFTKVCCVPMRACIKLWMCLYECMRMELNVNVIFTTQRPHTSHLSTPGDLCRRIKHVKGHFPQAQGVFFSSSSVPDS